LLAAGAWLYLTLLPGLAWAGEPPGLTLSPSRAEGVIVPGISVGPFGFSNSTSNAYKVTVLPVLLTQDRSGGVLVRDDQSSLARARRFLRPDVKSFKLRSGERRDVGGTVTQVPKDGSLYGGLLFHAEPKGRQSQIIQTLQLNASILLSPPTTERRVAIGAGDVTADQKGNRPIRISVAVTNRGNTYLPADGSIRVVGPKGRSEGTVQLGGQRILPGATVDLSGTLTKRLPAATYNLEATATMAGKTGRASGKMILTAPGQLEFQDAALTDIPAPQAEKGKPVDFSATYRNTGNVDFTPQAEVRVKPIRHGNVGSVASTQSLDVAATGPGDEGQISGSVDLPGDAQAYELELRLLDGKRQLDSRSVSVAPRPGVGLGTRIKDWITGNAVWLVALLVGLMALITLGAVYHARRVRSAPQATRREPPAPPRAEPPSFAPHPPRPDPRSFDPPPAVAGNGARVSLSSATYEELRALGMSMTQALRVLHYREQNGPFSSVDELRDVGGFPQYLLADVKRRAIA